MKSRHSPNLYEILRSASAPRENASASAAKVEPPEASSAVAVAPPPPPPPVVHEPEPVVEAPPPPPPPPVVERERVVVVPAPALYRSEAPGAGPAVVERPQPVAAPGFGERSLHITYNTLLFSGLVVVGSIFLAFTLGVRTGRTGTEAVQAPPELTNVAPEAPAVPAPKFTIRLIEYRARDSQQATAAQVAAIRYKGELERLGLKEAVVETLGKGADRRVVLRYGEYTNAAADSARQTLKKLKELKLDKGAKEPTFAKTAQFITVTAPASD